MKDLFKEKLPHIFGIAGVVFIFLSMFSVKDLAKLDVIFVSPIKIEPMLAGIFFITMSIMWHLAPHLTVPLSWTSLSKITKTSDGFQATIGRATIEICFCEIQKLVKSEASALVVLPANDLFDDKCIEDPRSSLGAFVNSMFPNQVHLITNLAKENRPEVSVLPNGKSKYDIGSTIYLDRPLSKDIRLAFLAVTTITDNYGIRCESSDIFKAIKGLQRLLALQRLDTVVLPIIGSGHGGLHPPVSLICMLIAFAECLKEPSGHHLKSVRIVVYQKNKNEKPAISYWQTRRLLAFVQRYCQAG